MNCPTGILLRASGLALYLLFTTAASAQSSASVLITPNRATILVGDSQSFRLVDQSGQMQRRVEWSVSDIDAFVIDDGDELTIIAKREGDYSISARCSNGSATATIKVVEGQELPQGTVKWSSGNDGCKTTKIMPAVPSAGGPDVFEQSECQDGLYIAAYAPNGIQMWRRKVSDSSDRPNADVQGGATSPASPALKIRSASICDSAVVGTDRRNILEMLRQRKLAFSERPPGNSRLVIEEANVHCDLWFDSNSVLSRKRKTLVSE